MILIGITGYKNSGKNTVAELIAECGKELNYCVINRSFADKIKWSVARLFWPQITMEKAIEWADHIKDSPSEIRLECFGDIEKVINGRELFQNEGMGGREIFGWDFWVDQLLPKYGNNWGPTWEDSFQNSSRADIATISDVRFDNEAARIIELGGSIWEVKRPGWESDGHITESLINPRHVKVTLINDGDLQELKNNVRKIYGLG